MSRALTVNIAISDETQDVQVVLDAERALFYPAEQALLIADPHFGKAESFQSAGIAIPSVILVSDLARLDHLIDIYAPKQLIVLGDFFHTKESQSEGVLQQLAAWRTRHRELAIGLVPGNHDVHAGAPPPDLAVEPLAPESTLGPFCLVHEPLAPDMTGTKDVARGYRLAGHLHPAVRLHGAAGTTSAELCFVVGSHQAILPAFGHFTGRHIYRPVRTDRIYVVGPGEILEMTRGAPPQP